MKSPYEARPKVYCASDGFDDYDGCGDCVSVTSESVRSESVSNENDADVTLTWCSVLQSPNLKNRGKTKSLTERRHRRRNKMMGQCELLPVMELYLTVLLARRGVITAEELKHPSQTGVATRWPARTHSNREIFSALHTLDHASEPGQFPHQEKYQCVCQRREQKIIEGYQFLRWPVCGSEEIVPPQGGEETQ